MKQDNVFVFSTVVNFCSKGCQSNRWNSIKMYGIDNDKTLMCPLTQYSVKSDSQLSFNVLWMSEYASKSRLGIEMLGIENILTS